MKLKHRMFRCHWYNDRLVKGIIYRNDRDYYRMKELELFTPYEKNIGNHWFEDYPYRWYEFYPLKRIAIKFYRKILDGYERLIGFRKILSSVLVRVIAAVSAYLVIHKLWS